MKKTNILVFLLTIALVLAVIPASDTEAASNKNQVKKVVNTYFKNAKKHNFKKMSKYALDSSYDSTVESDINSKLFKFYRKQNKKYFRYKIKSVKVSGNNAKVSLRVTYRSYKKATTAAYGELIKEMMIRKINEDKMFDYLYKYLKTEAKKNKPKTISKTITLKLKKGNNKWKLDNPGVVALDVVTCDFISSFLAILANPK